MSAFAKRWAAVLRMLKRVSWEGEAWHSCYLELHYENDETRNITLDAQPGSVTEKNRNEPQRENVRLTMTERNEVDDERRGAVVEIFKW